MQEMTLFFGRSWIYPKIKWEKVAMTFLNSQQINW